MNNKLMENLNIIDLLLDFATFLGDANEIPSDREGWSDEMVTAYLIDRLDAIALHNTKYTD